ncbi:MAG TPA: DNA-directed DNA polymerase I [Nitrososphaeraceae archaeon]|nr:DNA-directed DNA polymerase I [Nitrososphaeraceae archaeon]
MTQEYGINHEKKSKYKSKKDFIELPENKKVILLSAIYSGEDQKVLLKFYDPELKIIYFWKDRTNHKPYCYTKTEYKQKAEEILKKESKYKSILTKKIDLIRDQEIDILKIVAPDPLSIGGTSNSLREKITAWEADIKYHENYLYDNSLVPGTYYYRKNSDIYQYKYEIDPQIQNKLYQLINTKINNLIENNNKNYEYYIAQWVELLNQPIPTMKRIAIDIEVESEEGRIPHPRDHDKKITAIGLAGNDGFRKVYILDNRVSEDNKSFIPEAVLVKTERELIQAAFENLKNYPIILTFNGDDFDLPYLYMRSQDSRIDPVNKEIIQKEDIPIIIKRETFVKRGMQAEAVNIQHGIHIDLFRTFQNRSVQIYAFNHKYADYTLNSISEALLKDHKIEFEGNISDIPINKLAEYCLKDAELTLRLTTFNDNLLIKLLIVISRIAHLPIDDASRFGVNQWIRGMLYYEHRQNNSLIPRRDELITKGVSSTTALIKEKKYRGGLVVEPELGIHFNVVVVDFASLYPSIIKVHNLSYETVNCSHQSCKQDMKQQISGTTHWICKKRRGLTSLLIGSLRDLRVKYYKQLSKDKAASIENRQLYEVISQAIKVILNASYGVMGAEIFPLYCLPVADATAAIGRITTTRTIEKCKEIGIEVIYGDTDSLFLKNPSPDKVKSISEWAKKNLEIDLEIDKTYRYVVFSDLKKNYLGVLQDGTVDVKGLTGKKSHTPPFIRKAFYRILEILREVNSEKDFEKAKEKIRDIIKRDANDLEAGKIKPSELSFNVMVNKSPDRYGEKTNNSKVKSIIDGKNIDYITYKGLPQHIRAALLLHQSGKKIKAGDIISYVKTKNNDGVKPVELIKNINEIDTEKYIEAMESTFDQLLSALNFNFKSILGKDRQANLDELFWSKK